MPAQWLSSFANNLHQWIAVDVYGLYPSKSDESDLLLSLQYIVFFFTYCSPFFKIHPAL